MCSFVACVNQSTKPADVKASTTPLFELLDADYTNVHFQNVITETEDINFITNESIYAGGGLTVGDVNNDGLVDMYFVANTQAHKLYLNKGDFTFEEVSVKAGIKRLKGWSSGAAMVDINQDGWLDIYVGRGGGYEKNPDLRTNVLYINQGVDDNGIPIFTEQAKTYGLDDSAATSQAAFLDYDLDGDLDVYVLNHPVNEFGYDFEKMNRIKYNPPAPYYESSDRLYQNNGDNTFTDVTVAAGVANWAYGLGIGIGDLNQDGWPDIYITNDYEIENFYYINNQDGTFKQGLQSHMGHVSFYAMGVDIGDINNDGLLDVYESEMLPESYSRNKRNMQAMNVPRFNYFLESGFHRAYMRNMLHLNNGQGIFTEIAQLADVDDTDWSWGTLIVDLDNDGWKDLFVANGIIRDVKDRDYTHKANAHSKKHGRVTWDYLKNLPPSERIQNYAFKNKKDLTFDKVSNTWGFTFKGFSNAVAYADFDKDGDLDLVISNLNDKPLLYKNTARERNTNYLQVELKGPTNNKRGLGAKITLHTSAGTQYQELYTVRGFQSSSEAIAHFGLGSVKGIDKLEIVWPDAKREVITNLTVNQRLTVNYANAKVFVPEKMNTSTVFAETTKQLKTNYQHQEISYNDFEKEVLLPHKLSQLGPSIAVGDVNSDGLDDFYIGGATNYAGALFVQQPNATFVQKGLKVWSKDKVYEDMGTLFFDADNDDDLDLYVASGSNEVPEGASSLYDRLYLNDGKGNFTRAKQSLPKIGASTSCVVASDIDNDGDLDLFVGSRVRPAGYPLTPKSYLLENNGGVFTDITETAAPIFKMAGLVTSAVFSDYDGDNDEDLIVVGEWLPISVYNNDNGKFTSKTISLALQHSVGWWNTIIAHDFDGDGDHDYVAGNVGLNHKFRPSEKKPLHLYFNDFDNSGTIDIVLAKYTNNTLYPVRGKDCSSEQMPFISDKFPTFAAFGNANLADIYGKNIEEQPHYEAKQFASCYIENTGTGLVLRQLPMAAQLSATTAIVAYDFNADGHDDIALAGNMHHTESETSRMDGGIGLLLLGDGNGNFEPCKVQKSAFYVPHDVKNMQLLQVNNKTTILVANNDNYMQAFTVQ